VTVLIGLSIKGYARCGIVHQVFSDADEAKSVTYWGTGEHGVFKYDYEPSMTLETCLARKAVKLDALNNRGEPDEKEMTRVAASLSHFNDRMKSIIQSIEPVEIKRIGGAGNKANNLAINNVDAYIHPSPGLMHWDLCAPEALIKGMGGYATNLCGERLKYPLGTNCKLKGLLLGKSKKHHKAI
jgi:3'(2'), 5'-bisphosphate nucleotidase